MTYREPCGKRPCTSCPFRRKAPAGWLGAATPESFIIEISMERPLPCHPTIDYDDKRWLEKWTAQEIGSICAGSLIMSANMAKAPRDRAFPQLPRNEKIVFATPTEFINHHRASTVRSWETSETFEIRYGKRKK